MLSGGVSMSVCALSRVQAGEIAGQAGAQKRRSLGRGELEGQSQIPLEFERHCG